MEPILLMDDISSELDKENDYYMRQASPLHDPDDGTFGDDLEDIVGK